MRVLKACIMLCLLFSTGCWDKKELNKMAVVIGVGLDKVDDKHYKATAQVIKPSPQNQGGRGGSELPTWSLSANGITIMDAIAELNRISPRRLYWPHLQLIVFGEDMARSGISTILTWFERDRDSRSGTYVTVTRGTAEELLNQKIELGNIPSKAMADLIDSSVIRQITARKTTLRDLVSILSTPGIDPVLDVLDPKEIRGRIETYALNDGAVFRHERMVGFLTSDEVAAAEIINGTYRNAVLNVTCPRDANRFLTYLVTDFRKDIRLVHEENNYVMKVHVFMEGNLGDQSCLVDLFDPEARKNVEKAIAKEVKEMIQRTFVKTAAWKSDIYGIGRELRRFYPEDWRTKQEQWPELLARTKFNITVDASIRRSGLVLEPTPEKIK
ncbi:MAG: hypothetical protein K0S39_1310 [Paenibacillus sp.]|jgi:spore germination protein KC|nr:hypothetical protein [Paenibacillus sp.]